MRVWCPLNNWWGYLNIFLLNHFTILNNANLIILLLYNDNRIKNKSSLTSKIEENNGCKSNASLYHQCLEIFYISHCSEKNTVRLYYNRYNKYYLLEDSCTNVNGTLGTRDVVKLDLDLVNRSFRITVYYQGLNYTNCVKLYELKNFKKSRHQKSIINLHKNQTSQMNLMKKKEAPINFVHCVIKLTVKHIINKYLSFYILYSRKNEKNTVNQSIWIRLS